VIGPAAAALQAWPELKNEPVRPLDGGLINDTFVVGEPPVAVLQRQHPMFPARACEDIDRVTRHLAERGMLTPRLLRSGDGAAGVLDAEGRTWRALTWVPGVTHDTVTGPALAAEAGRLVARWHRATEDLQHEFAFSRPGAHDTVAHVATLAAALERHPKHRLYDDVAALAERLMAAWERWDGELGGPVRITHGDLKISNLRFDDAGRGLCLLDFDTLGKLPLEVELGDAARSWCNPRGEDVEEASVDVELFGAAFGAYVAERPLPASTRRGLVLGLERSALELAARFAADALNESYFGWRAAVAPARGEHNLLRARGQASLAASVAERRSELERALAGKAPLRSGTI